MKKITIVFILSFLGFSCKDSDRIDADLSNIKDIEIIQCYSLEEIFNGFLNLNEIVKKDSNWLNNHQNSIDKLIREVDENSQLNDYPLFLKFKPYGYFDGQSMTYIQSSFLGVVENNNKNILLSQLVDSSIKNEFPSNINFFYIPSPFIDTMSVLIGSKTKKFNQDFRKENISAIGFQKIESYDLNGKKSEKSDYIKSLMPYIVFNETGKSSFSSGEYLIKLTLKDTVVFKSLNRFNLENDTIFFESLFSRKYINKKIKPAYNKSKRCTTK